MSKAKKTHTKATRTQLERMRRQVMLHMAVSLGGMVLVLIVYGIILWEMGLFSAADGVCYVVGGLFVAILLGALFLAAASLPLLYFLFHLIPKYRRIDSLLYPEDYEKWMRLNKTSTHKLPKEDVQTAHRIYKQFRPNLPAGTQELEALLKKELKQEWYRRLTIAMLCGLLLNCPDFTDTDLLHRAMTERNVAAQFIFPVWLECMEGRAIHRREIIARQFLTYWDKKLFTRR